MQKWLKRLRESQALQTGDQSINNVNDNVNLVSKVSDTLPDLESALLHTPLTISMIKTGLAKYREPFDEEDLQDIKHGRLALETVVSYLNLWAQTNPDKLNQLEA